MKVLVTGGCGFLGSHVCEYYARRGAEVIAYDNMTKYELLRTGFATDAARSFNWDLLAALNVTLVKADVRNLEQLLDHAEGADYIIHTAAQPAMTISWEDPQLDLTTNVLGTFNVLETARQRKIPVASCATIHIYGNEINNTLREEATRYVRDEEGISEQHPTLTGVLTPLHASKSAADTYVRTYIDTYQTQAASFRLTGIYGPRQFGGEDHGWVANFCIRSLTGRPITIFGSGKQIRDILYASDVCEAFDAFYRAREPGVYNIGGSSRTGLSLLECIDVIEAINGQRPTVQFAADRLGDLRYFICDISKARRLLRWEPQVEPREGIALLLDWVRQHRALFTAEQQT